MTGAYYYEVLSVDTPPLQVGNTITDDKGCKWRITSNTTLPDDGRDLTQRLIKHGYRLWTFVLESTEATSSCA